MKTRLDQYASDLYSQDGEDGCIEHIFQRIGVGTSIAVEFGAGQGVAGSNTARLWRDQDWTAYLIEPDPRLFLVLRKNTMKHKVSCQRAFVMPTGADSIGEMLSVWGVTATIDFMSIDVDGNDYAILAELTCRPRVVCIEFNPTVPPHISLRQAQHDEMFGASLLAIIELAQRLGYRFVGATRCNAFLVVEDEAAPFDNYETDPTALFSHDRYTYAVTDFSGRMTLCGAPLPWDAKAPYVLPLIANVPVFPSSNDVDQIRKGFEAQWGPAAWYTPADFAASTIDLQESHVAYVLSSDPPLVCFDMTNDSPDTIEFYAACAETRGYRSLLIGRVLGLVKEPQ